MGSFDRRDFLRKTAMALAAMQLGLPVVAHAQPSDPSTRNGTRSTIPEPTAHRGFFMRPVLTGQPTPAVFGSVSQAPTPPDAFAGPLSTPFPDPGALRQHVVIGGAGPPLLLVHGWPQTWYA